MARKHGRPKREFSDLEFAQIEEMAKLQMVKFDICKVMNIDEKTLSRIIKEKYNMVFSDWFDKYSEDGKMSLRQAQFNNAVKHNNSRMQIWLGQQWLGQKNHDMVTVQEIDPTRISEIEGELFVDGKTEKTT